MGSSGYSRSMSAKFSPDQPELRTLAQLAGVAPDRLASAYNDPEHFLEHMNLDELKRVQVALERLGPFVLNVAASTARALKAINKRIG